MSYYQLTIPELLDQKVIGCYCLKQLYCYHLVQCGSSRLFTQFTKGPINPYLSLLYQARFVYFNLLATNLLAFFGLAFVRFFIKMKLRTAT
jgi:hypothetical protein